MPVVHVRSLAVDEPEVAGLLVEVARRVAAETPCALDDVWCTFQPLTAQTLGGRVVRDEGRIVYVDVWMRARGEPAARALAAACAAAAAGTGVPAEDVWGALHPVEPGRVFAGGSVIT